MRLIIPGEARGKGRPRFVRATGRTYTDEPTKTAEARIFYEWAEAGRPEFGPEALSMKLEIIMARPKSHLRADGTVNPKGAREPWPVRKPDLDNVWKLVADSLNGYAYPDDSQIVSGHIWRRWARPGESARMIVEIWPAPTPLEAVA